MGRCLQEHEWKCTKLEPLSQSLTFRVVGDRWPKTCCHTQRSQTLRTRISEV